MAPKIKVTKEMVVSSALDFVMVNGYDALNARAIAKQLQCSTQPVYSYFDSMDEVRDAVYEEAKTIARNNLYASIDEGDFLLTFSHAYVNLAIEHPELFKLVFMFSFKEDCEHTILGIITGKYDVTGILGELGTRYRLERDAITETFVRAWYFVHGIACSIVDKAEKPGMEDLDGMIQSTVRDIVHGTILRLGF